MLAYPRFVAERSVFSRFGLGGRISVFFRISDPKIQFLPARAFGARGCLVDNCGGGARKNYSFVSASFWRVFKTSPVSALCETLHIDKIPILSHAKPNARNLLSRAHGAKKWHRAHVPLTLGRDVKTPLVSGICETLHFDTGRTLIFP